MDETPSPGDVAAIGRRPAAGALAVGTSAIAWWPAFTLGAWGVVFFDQLMLLWAVSTAAFVALVLGASGEHLSRYRLAALLVPTGWLVLALLSPTGQVGRLGVLAEVIGTAITILGIPFMVLLLLRVASPSAIEVRARRDRLAAAAAVLVVVLASYGLGVENAKFLTCRDFEVSGNSAPKSCTPGSPTLGSSISNGPAGVRDGQVPGPSA